MCWIFQCAARVGAAAISLTTVRTAMFLPLFRTADTQKNPQVGRWAHHISHLRSPSALLRQHCLQCTTGDTRDPRGTPHPEFDRWTSLWRQSGHILAYPTQSASPKQASRSAVKTCARFSLLPEPSELLRAELTSSMAGPALLLPASASMAADKAQGPSNTPVLRHSPSILCNVSSAFGDSDT